MVLQLVPGDFMLKFSLLYAAGEKNVAFHTHLNEFVGSVYESSAKEVRSMSQQLAKCQGAIQVTY